MPRLGRFSVPVLSLSQCIHLVRQALPVLRSGVTRKNLAQAWGLSPNSGWFGSQVAALKNYGLVRGRGKIYITQLAEKLLFPADEQELLKAKREAWLNVEIIQLLHDRLKGTIPEENGPLIALLQEITGEHRDKITKHISLIKRLYAEAVEALKVSEVEEETMPTSVERAPSEVSATKVIELRMGDVRIWLPPTKRAIEMARLLLLAFEKSLEGEPHDEHARLDTQRMNIALSQVSTDNDARER